MLCVVGSSNKLVLWPFLEASKDIVACMHPPKKTEVTRTERGISERVRFPMKKESSFFLWPIWTEKVTEK